MSHSIRGKNYPRSRILLALCFAMTAMAQQPSTDSTMAAGDVPATAKAIVADSISSDTTGIAPSRTDTVDRTTAPPISDSSDSGALRAAPQDTTGTSPNAPGTQVDSTVGPPDTSNLAGIRRMETTLVRGKLRGKAKAQQERKNADNRKDILSIESIQEHPDPTVADALERAPGVTLQNEPNEGHYVKIRGAEPRLSNVTVNGQQMTSSSGDTRAVDLDVIPVDQLSEIEVTKVLMPEMDGDAIGGTVNLVTPSATDTQMVFKALLATGLNELPNRPVWQGSAALSKRMLRDGALGIYLGGSWFQTHTRTDDIEMDWDTMPGQKNVIWNLEQREYQNTKERLGFSGRLDWRTPEGSIAYLIGNWNRTSTDQLRNRFRINRQGATAISPDTPDSMKTADVMKFTREVFDKNSTETVSQATLGGNSRLGPVALDLSVTGSSGTTDQDPSMQADFSPKHQFNSYINPTDPDVPTFYSFHYPLPAAIDVGILNASEWGLSQITSTTVNASENDLHGRMDARMAVGEDSSLVGSTGAKWGWNRKNQILSGYAVGTKSGSTPYNLTNVLSPDSVVGFYNGHYTIGPLPDVDAIRSWLAANKQLVDTTISSDEHLQNDPLSYTMTQFHWAGYAEGKWRDGDLSAVGGVRAERFDVRSTGNDVHLQTNQSWDYTVPITVDRTFDFLLPMASFRWSPDPRLVARASYTRSFSLPDPLDLLPTKEFFLLDQMYKVGNPDLEATVADAVELDLEWYGSRRATASIDVFGKRLENYIFPRVWGSYDQQRKLPFTYYAKQNGTEAWLNGVELQIQQPLSFLPWFLSGLGVDANYTWTNSSTTLPGRTTESRLPGQAAHSGNLGLRYDMKGFSLVLAGVAQSASLYQVGTDARYDIWLDQHVRWDASISQRLWHGLLVYFQAANLTNSPFRLYQSDTQHPTQIEYSGRTYEGGIRISL